MPDAAPKIRLFVADDLGAGPRLALPKAQAHYLRHVMRCPPGTEVALFNGRDGEWRAAVEGYGKAEAALSLHGRLRPQAAEAGPWLLFAPLKRGPMELMLEKAVELGASRLMPVLTQRSVVGRLNAKRLQAIVVEAAEQCGRLTVPELAAPVALAELAAGWPAGRRLIFCDEAGDAPPLAEVAAAEAGGALALLIGPEGGFDEAERAALRALPFVRPASLGPRILRAETAALAGLAVLQAVAGDWRLPAEAGGEQFLRNGSAIRER
jgi:16S rRNA (uracil1498-N3)-methyltransferase